MSKYKTKQNKNAIFQEHEAVRRYGKIAVRHVVMLDMLALLLLLECVSRVQNSAPIKSVTHF